MFKIPLTQGKETLVDDEDYEYLSQWKWHYGGKKYAVRRGPNNSKIMMHRVILNAPNNKEVDHINYNRLDNRKENLRLATTSQNKANLKKPIRKGGSTSKYKGVSKSKRNKKFKANIIVNGKYIHLGYFTNEKEAAMIYNENALTYFGKYARLNKIEE